MLCNALPNFFFEARFVTYVKLYILIFRYFVSVISSFADPLWCWCVAVLCQLSAVCEICILPSSKDRDVIDDGVSSGCSLHDFMCNFLLWGSSACFCWRKLLSASWKLTASLLWCFMWRCSGICFMMLSKMFHVDEFLSFWSFFL